MSKTDYDLTLIRGVVFDVDGVLSPVCVPMDADGIPRRMANLRDGFAIQRAVKNGIKIGIISGANDTAIIGRFTMLGIPTQDIRLVTGPKLQQLVDWMQTHGLQPHEVAYVGDDIPDLQCLKTVGLPIAPSDAAPEAIAAARYVTTATGGHGVAREVLEQILKAVGAWSLTASANDL